MIPAAIPTRNPSRTGLSPSWAVCALLTRANGSPTRIETVIEHIVARSEAHDSGLCAADAATHRRFARDLRNLKLASPWLNRYRKVAKDTAEWLPEKNRCWFAQCIIGVCKVSGDLAIPTTNLFLQSNGGYTLNHYPLENRGVRRRP